MKLEDFLRPLYQDLDGASRFDEVERIGAIARQLAPASRTLDLLILFHPLGTWLEKFGNLSRILLAVPEVSETDLRQTSASIRRLADPQSVEERAVASAILIAHAGVRGLAERLARARREGQTVDDVAREAPAEVPEWMDARAREWLVARSEERARFARALLEEDATRP